MGAEFDMEISLTESEEQHLRSVLGMAPDHYLDIVSVKKCLRDCPPGTWQHLAEFFLENVST